MTSLADEGLLATTVDLLRPPPFPFPAPPPKVDGDVDVVGGGALTFLSFKLGREF